MRTTVRVFLTALLVALVPAMSRAQTTSTILGVVKDSSGGVLPGVAITAKHLATNGTRTVVTADDGNFVLPFMAVGDYDLTAELSGFDTATRRVAVAVDQRVGVDLVLKVGSISETTTVVGEVPLVEVSTSDIGSVIENRRIVDLPLDGRNFIALNALDAGAATRTGASSCTSRCLAARTPSADRPATRAPTPPTASR